jgi:hypothetical protein
MLALVIAAGALGWSWWTIAPYLGHGSESYYRQHDTADSNAAFYVGQREFARRSLVGNWTPTAGGGVDARANGKHALPLLDLLFRLLPFWWLTGAFLWAESAAALLLTAWLLHRRLGVAPALALAAGATYSVMYAGVGGHSGFYLGYGTVVPLMPGVILLLASAGEQAKLWKTAAVAAFTGLALAVSGSATLAVAAIPLAAAWIYGVESRGRLRHLFALVICGGVLAIFTAPTFVAMAIHAADAHRTLWPIVPYGLETADAVWTNQRAAAEVLFWNQAPWLGVAAVGWLLGGYRRRALNVAIILTLAIVLQLYFMVPVRAVLRWVYEPFASIQLDRVNVFVPFLAAVAAGIGLGHIWQSGRERSGIGRWRLAAAVALAGAMLVMSAGHVREVNRERETRRAAGSTYARFFQRPELQQLARETIGDAPFRVATFTEANAGAGQHPGFAWAYGLETIDGYLNLYPRRFHAFWGQVIKPTLDLDDVTAEYFGHWGNRIYLFNGFMGSEPQRIAGHAFDVELLSLANVRFLISAVELVDPRLVLRTPVPAEPVGSPLFVYENRDALPRFFVTHSARTYSSETQALEALAASSVDTMRRTAFIDDPDRVGDVPVGDEVSETGSAMTSKIDVGEYSADRIALAVETGAAGTLVVSNTFSRYWTATVDGARVPLLRVNGVFQGVPLAGGRQSVVLTYNPPYAQFLRYAPLTAMAFVIVCSIGWQRASRVPRRVSRTWKIAVPAVATAVILVVWLARPDAGGPPVAPWHDDGHPFRQAIDVLNTKGAGVPFDVPVLIRQDPSDTAFWNAMRGSPGLNFFSDAGEPLAFEIEELDLASQHLAAWVRVPSLGNRPQTLTMYFGGESTTPAPQRARVWEGRYAAVWHMSDPSDGNTTADSTSFGHTGTVPERRAGKWRIRGKSGGAFSMDGVGEGVRVAPSASLPFSGEHWGIEFWARIAEQENRTFGFVEFGSGPLLFHLRYGNVMMLDRMAPASAWPFHAATLTTGEWTHVALVRSGARMKTALNGKFKQAAPEPPVVPAGSDPLVIGSGFLGTLHGDMDEVRILAGPTPPGWARASYLAQTGALLTPRPIETRPDRTKSP